MNCEIKAGAKNSERTELCTESRGLQKMLKWDLEKEIEEELKEEIKRKFLTKKKLLDETK